MMNNINWDWASSLQYKMEELEGASLRQRTPEEVLEGGKGVSLVISGGQHSRHRKQQKGCEAQAYLMCSKKEGRSLAGSE